jgi:hypothetical protein
MPQGCAKKIEIQRLLTNLPFQRGDALLCRGQRSDGGWRYCRLRYDRSLRLQRRGRARAMLGITTIADPLTARFRATLLRS